jgi:hypothetical protein
MLKSPEERDRRHAPDAVVHRYVVYGLVVESEFRLNSVAAAPQARAEPWIRFCLASPDALANQAALPIDSDDWIQHVILPDGAVHMRLDDVFDALVAADGRSVRCARLGDADARSFEANLLNFVLSAALTLRGEEPLHATVLDLGERAIALLGPSGAGKSTLAAHLIGEGATLVTDDMLRLTFQDGTAFAHHGPHRLKLFDEPARRLLPQAASDGDFNAVSGKLMVEPVAAHRRDTPRPLAALFWLDEPPAPSSSDEVSVSRLAGLELMRLLTASAMDIRNHTPNRLARQLAFVQRVARTVPVHALRYARHYGLLARVAEQIRRTAGS